MRHVLFVDDEPRILEGLENLMFPYMDEWEVSLSEGAENAIELLEQNRYDVLVTDMRMPGMDGSALLQAVQQRHPEVVRVVLSGHSEFEPALRAMSIAHQFLSKPCDGATLVNTLQRACELRELIDDESMRSVLGSVTQLPARPATYDQLTKAMAEENWNLSDVAKIVEQDIAIATKILHVANTAFFSRGQSITNLAQAVPRLGATFVRDIVLGIEVYQNFTSTGGIDIDELHRRCFKVGRIAQKMVPSELSEEAFLAGLLHDVGRLVLATALPAESARIESEVQKGGVTRQDAERECFGASHAEVGAYLLGLWGMTYPVIEAVANHHTPERIASDELGLACALYIAGALYDALHDNKEEDLEPSYLKKVGVEHKLEEWRLLAREVLETSHE